MPHKPFVNKKLLAHRKVIGEKVRQLRGERHLTLKETAQLCGLSIAHISELERGRLSPTVTTMFKVAAGFEKPISYFLPEEYMTTAQITRQDEQEALVSANSREVMLNNGMPGGKLKGSHLTLGKGGIFEPKVDPRSEIVGIVLKGEMELTTDGEKYRLKKGDVLHLHGKPFQQVKNLSQGKSEMMLIREIPAHLERSINQMW